MVASSIPCKSSLCADRAHACAGDSHTSSGIDVASPTTQSVLAIASLHELQGDTWPSSLTGISFCCNQQCSVTATTTSTGPIAERYAYSAYGQPTILDGSGSVLSSSATNNRYTYTGREWDATLGLHHFRARWMSPSAGRFLARDPIGYAGMNALLYCFLDGQSLIGLDPSGLRQTDDTPHQDGRKRCVVVLPSGQETGALMKMAKELEECFDKTILLHNFPSRGDQVTKQQILKFVDDNDCCELVIFGHQGGATNPRGTMQKPRGSPDEIILPDPIFEDELGQTLNEQCNEKPAIVMYACGHIRDDVPINKKDYEDKRDKVRCDIAERTNCSVWGTTSMLNVPSSTDKKSDWPTPCPKLHGKKIGNGAGVFVPIPLTHYD